MKPFGVDQNRGFEGRQRSPMLDLKTLRELAQNATGGEWRVNANGEIIGGRHEVIADARAAHTTRGKADAAHIAAFSPTTALALIDLVERLRKAVDECYRESGLGQPDWTVE